ncbi:MAG: IS3 family transposase, partial [Hyphomicrobiaceae bacterium]
GYDRDRRTARHGRNPATSTPGRLIMATSERRRISTTLTDVISELLARRRFASQVEARMAVFSYIEGFYNPVRLHSALGYRSPIIYEKEHMQVVGAEP